MVDKIKKLIYDIYNILEKKIKDKGFYNFLIIVGICVVGFALCIALFLKWVGANVYAETQIHNACHLKISAEFIHGTGVSNAIDFSSKESDLSFDFLSDYYNIYDMSWNLLFSGDCEELKNSDILNEYNLDIGIFNGLYIDGNCHSATLSSADESEMVYTIICDGREDEAIWYEYKNDYDFEEVEELWSEKKLGTTTITSLNGYSSWKLVVSRGHKDLIIELSGDTIGVRAYNSQRNTLIGDDKIWKDESLLLENINYCELSGNGTAEIQVNGEEKTYNIVKGNDIQLKFDTDYNLNYVIEPIRHINDHTEFLIGGKISGLKGIKINDMKVLGDIIMLALYKIANIYTALCFIGALGVKFVFSKLKEKWKKLGDSSKET